MARNHPGVLRFMGTFLRQPDVVGAVLPSSRRLAEHLIRPFKQRTRPAKVLELGAGTGAVTMPLGHELGPEDELDIFEIQPELVHHLEKQVLSQPQFDRARREGRVKLYGRAVQEIGTDRRYDFVISGLPFTAFDESQLSSVLALLPAIVMPGGIFSYFEYVALRRLRSLGSFGTARRRRRAVDAILDDYIERFEIDRRTVLANFPPAFARHWRFDAPQGATLRQR
ncbi:MAG: hypothetical protein V3W34_19485 [Phycisphaerae bacterium]